MPWCPYYPDVCIKRINFSEKINLKLFVGTNIIVIRNKLVFLFIGREPTTWPTNNCLQIMVCSCAMPSNSVWLQIIFCSSVKETAPFSFLRSFLRENGISLRFPRIFIKKKTRWSNDKTIIQLGYRKISWFISVCLADQLLICSPQTNHHILFNLVQ